MVTKISAIFDYTFYLFLIFEWFQNNEWIFKKVKLKIWHIYYENEELENFRLGFRINLFMETAKKIVFDGKNAAINKDDFSKLFYLGTNFIITNYLA